MDLYAFDTALDELFLVRDIKRIVHDVYRLAWGNHGHGILSRTDAGESWKMSAGVNVSFDSGLM